MEKSTNLDVLFCEKQIFSPGKIGVWQLFSLLLIHYSLFFRTSYLATPRLNSSLIKTRTLWVEE